MTFVYILLIANLVLSLLGWAVVLVIYRDMMLQRQSLVEALKTLLRVSPNRVFRLYEKMQSTGVGQSLNSIMRVLYRDWQELEQMIKNPGENDGTSRR
jgi:hypothetical protein